jgi:hypothetical protein
MQNLTAIQHIIEATHLMIDKKHRVRPVPGTKCNFERHAFSDLLPSAKLYFLKFPPSLKIALSARDQIVNT